MVWSFLERSSALVCRDAESLDLLNQTGTSTWPDPGDPSDVAAKLIELENAWARGAPQIQEPNEDVIKSVTRESLTGRLVEMIGSLISSPNGRD